MSTFNEAQSPAFLVGALMLNAIEIMADFSALEPI